MACGSQPAATSPAAGADNAAVRSAFERHSGAVEVTAAGIVERVLSDQEGPSGTHERFIVRLSGVDLTVLIEHNVTIAPRVPVHVGGPVVVRGEYIWNSEGGLVHFTHHDPDRSHEGGYVLYAGTRYE